MNHNQSEEMYKNSPRLEVPHYTRHGRSPVSDIHLKALDCLYDAYNQKGNSEGDSGFYGPRIRPLLTSIQRNKATLE